MTMRELGNRSIYRLMKVGIVGKVAYSIPFFTRMGSLIENDDTSPLFVSFLVAPC